MHGLLDAIGCTGGVGYRLGRSFRCGASSPPAGVGVVQNPTRICLKRLDGADASPSQVCLDQRGLHEIFGGGPVAGQQVGGSMQGTRTSRDEFTELDVDCFASARHTAPTVFAFHNGVTVEVFAATAGGGRRVVATEYVVGATEAMDHLPGLVQTRSAGVLPPHAEHSNGAGRTAHHLSCFQSVVTTFFPFSRSPRMGVTGHLPRQTKRTYGRHPDIRQ